MRIIPSIRHKPLRRNLIIQLVNQPLISQLLKSIPLLLIFNIQETIYCIYGDKVDLHTPYSGHRDLLKVYFQRISIELGNQGVVGLDRLGGKTDPLTSHKPAIEIWQSIPKFIHAYAFLFYHSPPQVFIIFSGIFGG